MRLPKSPWQTHSECFAHDIVPKLPEEATISEKVSRSLRAQIIGTPFANCCLGGQV